MAPGLPAALAAVAAVLAVSCGAASTKLEGVATAGDVAATAGESGGTAEIRGVENGINTNPAGRKNFLILFVDDLGYNEINLGDAAPPTGGYTGYGGRVKTPALAQFAKEGMVRATQTNNHRFIWIPLGSV